MTLRRCLSRSSLPLTLVNPLSLFFGWKIQFYWGVSFFFITPILDIMAWFSFWRNTYIFVSLLSHQQWYEKLKILFHQIISKVSCLTNLIHDFLDEKTNEYQIFWVFWSDILKKLSSVLTTTLKYDHQTVIRLLLRLWILFWMKKLNAG